MFMQFNLPSIADSNSHSAWFCHETFSTHVRCPPEQFDSLFFEGFNATARMVLFHAHIHLVQFATTPYGWDRHFRVVSRIAWLQRFLRKWKNSPILKKHKPPVSLSETLQSQNLSPTIFVASDDDLLTAVAAENLPIDNPLDHRQGYLPYDFSPALTSSCVLVGQPWVNHVAVYPDPRWGFRAISLDHHRFFR